MKFSQEELRVFLGYLVQVGKEEAFGAFNHVHSRRIDPYGHFQSAQPIASNNLISRKRFEDAIREAANTVSSDELLRDPDFLVSLRVRINILIKRHVSGAITLLREELQGLFPPDKADHIHEAAVVSFATDYEKNGMAGLFPAGEKVAAMLNAQLPTLGRIAQELGKENTEAVISYTKRLSEHHNTRLVACPKCKTEKRVTLSGPSRTKRFRCSCNFEEDFPFATTTSQKEVS